MQLVRHLQGPKFEKTAAKFLLGDNPATYGSELLAQLYKQHSFLGSYKVDLSIEGQDDSLGYLYGVFMVSPAKSAPAMSGMPQAGAMAPEPPADPSQTLRIPVIVENKKAFSFDVFITPSGKFLPLSEPRVASAIFESSPYAVAGQTEAQLQSEEAQQGFGLEGSYGNAMGRSQYFNKQSSAIDPEAIGDFMLRVENDPELRDALKLNPAFAAAYERIQQASHTTKTASAPEEFEADVAVYEKVAGGYSIKMASFGGEFHEISLNNAQAEALDLSIRQQVISNGLAMAVSDSNRPLEGVEKTASLRTVEETGVYSVMNKHGSAQRAVVIKDVMRLDGTPSSSCLVIGPSGAALQEKVAGVRCGNLDLSSIQGSDARGEGVFVIGDVVTEPITINHRVIEKTATTLLYQHPLYGSGQLKLANVRKPTHIKGADYLFPQNARFVPVESGASYLDDLATVDKIASRHDHLAKVTLLSDGPTYSLRGGPISDGPFVRGLENIKEASALLILGLLGDTPVSAMQKIASARQFGAVEFVAARTLGSTPKQKVAGEAVDVSNIRIDLTKEAAALTDADTVDSVLSLNFITPENIQGYLSSMPDLELACQKLAELLVGVRLGLADVPESAVSAAMSGMERALTGLKKLQIRVGMENRA